MTESSNPPEPATASEEQQQEEEELPKVGVCGLLAACFCCLLCSPLLICCCCCAAADTAVNKSQGKRWDAKQHRWVLDNLDTEKETVPDTDDDILKDLEEEEEIEVEATSPEGSTKQVKETKYYEALGVAPDADESKIKRAYYVQARKYHPDKNDTPEAKEKFQHIGEAYQVLSDPQLRAVYDKEGEAGLSGDRTEVSPQSLDPSLVFTFLFGSDAFTDYVGRLQLVTQTMAADKISKSDMAELERRRTVRLALKLQERIQPFVDGKKEASQADWKTVAAELVETRYGEEILNTIGSSYKLVATQAVGTWGEGVEARQAEHEIQRDAAMAAYKGTKAMQKGDSAGQEEEQLPSYLEVMWNITVIDITTTLREVVMKVLHDASVESDIRKKRAEAIIALGEIFEAQKSKESNEEDGGGRHRRAHSLYMSAAQAAMEDTLNKMKEEEEKNAGDLD